MAQAIDDNSRQKKFWEKQQEIRGQVENMRSTSPQMFGDYTLPAMEGDQSIVEPETSQEPISPVHIQYGEDKPMFTPEERETPQISSMFDLIKPNLQKASAGEMPVIDEKEKARLEKQRKAGALSTGLQSLFGSIAMGMGYNAPVPSDALGRDAIAQLKDLDTKHYNDLANWRNQDQRANMYNVQVENQAAMQLARDTNAKLAGDQAYERTLAGQEKAFSNQKELLGLRDNIDDENRLDEYNKKINLARVGGSGKNKNLLPYDQRGVVDNYVANTLDFKKKQLNAEIAKGFDGNEAAIESLQKEIGYLQGIKEYDLDDPNFNRLYGQAKGLDNLRTKVIQDVENLSKLGQGDPQMVLANLQDYYVQTGRYTPEQAGAIAVNALRQQGIQIGGQEAPQEQTSTKEQLANELEQINSMPQSVEKQFALKQYEEKQKGFSDAQLKDKLSQDFTKDLGDVVSGLDLGMDDIQALRGLDGEQRYKKILPIINKRIKEIESDPYYTTSGGRGASPKVKEVSDLKRMKAELEASYKNVYEK